MEKQNLFTEEELAKVTDEAERKHLIECAQDQSTKEEMIIRPQDDVEMSDEDAMRMQMAMSAMKDKSMAQRIEG